MSLSMILSWLKGGRVEKNEESLWDFCPEYAKGAVIVRPLPDGRFGLFIKRVELTPPPRFGVVYKFCPFSDDSFATVEEARKRWLHTRRAPVVIFDPEAAGK